jgi:hypothetical protein
MTARMLAVDLRRGPAPVLGLAVLGLGGALVLGAGCDAVFSLRRAMWLVFPCVLAAGVWHGGSARRRHLDEAVTASALPAWRRSAVEGGSITVAGFAAFVLLFGAQTLNGGCPALTTGSSAAGVVAVLALGAAAFAGLALGRVAAAAMAAPLVLFAGLVVTSLFGGWSAASADVLLLLPGVAEDAAADQLTVTISVAQMLWFAGLAVSGWLCASRPRLAGLAPAAAGLIGLWALT